MNYDWWEDLGRALEENNVINKENRS